MNENGKRIYFGQVKKDSVKQQQSSIPTAKEDSDNEHENVQFLPFSKHVQRSHEKHEKLLDDFERKKRAKQVIVPTNDNLVKLKLRELGEPIILFGEKPEDRRSRLRELLIDKNILDGTPIALLKKEEEEESSDEEKENFLTEGTEELKQARINIALYSLKRAQQRLSESKKQREKELEIKRKNDELLNSGGGVSGSYITQERIEQMLSQRIKTDYEIARDETKKELKNYYASTSQIGDERPLSMAVFSPDSQLIAVSSWSGQSKIWSTKCEHLLTLTGHTQRASSIAFHPQSTISLSKDTLNLASTSADSTIKLWSLSNEQPLASLEGHLDVVNRCVFHPNGRYLMSTSNDKSWKMWDLETKSCLLDQEGHSAGVMGISVQDDGSLLSTGSQDGLVRVWDLRSGRPILYFEGHSKQVISVDWSPNSYQIASSSEDNSTIIWDIRKKEKVYQILAHSSIVSCVKFQKSNNYNNSSSIMSIGYLATCSFDGKIKCWEPYTWKPITTLEGHSSKVTSIDISNDNKIVSASFDKTWKIWSNEN